ncbi:MAG: Era-like GTP-binding protein [Proteobacteria bacterium]|nr:Era-like GTP-binding protein [Pseudomonadota bacterium]
MKLNSKSILISFIILVSLVSLLLVLVLTEKLLNIWSHLQNATIWMVTLYAVAIFLVALLAFTLWLQLIRPKKPVIKATHVVDESSLTTAINEQQAKGVDTNAAQMELDELEKRRLSDLFHIALYGMASAGKSSLINAILPVENVKTSITRGTTQNIQYHQYQQLVLVDMPGFDAIEAPADEDSQLARLAFEESQRSHVVVFLLDSDMTSTETKLFNKLKTLNKPMVIALNKIDVYDEEQLKLLIKAIKLKTHDSYPVVQVSTGGHQTIVYQNSDGSEHKRVEQRAVNIQSLMNAIEKVISHNTEALNRFRDAGILRLADKKLTQAKKSHNRLMAEEVIQSFTQKAIVGALASVAPGSDLIIQGAIGTKLVQAICQIYGIEARQIEIDQVIKLTGGKLKTSVSLILAVAGNALKAFPGVGTAAGGIMHAVAYGMIFNSLGRAVLESVSTQGQLDTELTKQKFEENLLGSSKEMAKDLAKMALKIKQSN